MIQTYIVFQGGHYEEEYASGFFWAPYYDNGGKQPHHWKRMTELKPGDKVFHYSKGYIRAISVVTSSWVDSDRRPDISDPDWRRDGRIVYCKPFILDDPIRISDYKDDIVKLRNEKYSAFKTDGGANRGYLFELEPEIAAIFEKAAGIVLPIMDDAVLPEEIVEEPGKPIIEGAKKTITINSYERDPKAKNECKKHYMKLYGKITCQVCGFDFGEAYGPECANMIHVHHIRPISEIGEEYVIDPVSDLIPVCPNCHMVLHSNGGIGVEELRQKMKKK